MLNGGAPPHSPFNVPVSGSSKCEVRVKNEEKGRQHGAVIQHSTFNIHHSTFLILVRLEPEHGGLPSKHQRPFHQIDVFHHQIDGLFLGHRGHVEPALLVGGAALVHEVLEVA